MTLFHALGPFAAQAGVVAAPGMVLLTPTSITHSGTSASIGANGQVTFTAVTSLSLNGVFSADFDNYVVSLRGVNTGGGAHLEYRLRVSGSDASGSNYTSQEIRPNGSSPEAFRTSGTSGRIGAMNNSLENGIHATIYGPFLAQPTAARGVNIYSASSADFRDFASTHSLSTSYDGITFIPPINAMTGALQVYGVRS